MTSLPISPDWIEQPLPALQGRVSQSYIGEERPRDEKALLQAFRSFAKVAGSLEQSYGQLQSEVERLRRALSEKDEELASSIEDKKNERARLLQLVEGLPCGVLVVFDTGKVWKANSEALRLISGSTKSPSPHSIETLPEKLRHLLTSIQNEDGERELEIAEDSFPARWIAARHAPLGDGMSVFILRDVTEHKCLQETQARLQRDRALAELSAILAHEVRNPLGSLELFAGLLAEAKLGAEERQWVDQVRGGLRSLAATVNNVLQFHSPSPPDFGEVEVRRLLEWVVDFCGPLARQSGVTLTFQTGEWGITLRGDRYRLQQVLLNLVLNSIRAVPEGGWVELAGRASADGKRVELVVADTGPGIPAECLSRMFQSGFSTRPGGAGLGLAVCRKIVEQHHGSIAVESSPERGTKIRLSFPRLRPEEMCR